MRDDSDQGRPADQQDDDQAAGHDAPKEDGPSSSSPDDGEGRINELAPPINIDATS